MAVQRHPIDSYTGPKVNFWEEFPDYKAHKVFGEFFRTNKTAKTLQGSSSLMWLLSLCYDRKSSLFSQPELDKWEAASEDLFGDAGFVLKLIEDPSLCSKVVTFKVGDSMHLFITEFERSIDSPLAASLRVLEKKLDERTKFIQETEYTLDSLQMVGSKQVLVKGTAPQLDKMFTDTQKIEGLIRGAMEALTSSVGDGAQKGGQVSSLGDSNKI